MRFSNKIIFKDLKLHIAEAIKESCYTTDVRLYNIANEVHNINTFTLEPGVEILHGLALIIDKSIKDSVELGCDLSVVVKGIMLGSFRSSLSTLQEAPKTIRILIKEIFQSVFKYNGDVKESVEGLLAAIIIISSQYKINLQEALAIAKEDLLSCTKETSLKFAGDIKEILSKSDI